MSAKNQASTSLRLALTSGLLLATVGCEALQPPPTPHPALVAATRGTRLAPRSFELVDPLRLEGLPIRQDEAIRRGTAGMDPATSGGVTVSWGAQATTRNGPRLGWVVMRGDPRDPELSGRVFPLEFVVIDAMTGEPINMIVRLAPAP